MRRDLIGVLLAVALFSAKGFAQSLPTAPNQAPNLSGGPQRQQPAGGRQQPLGGQKPGTTAIPARNNHPQYQGTLEGYIYWDTNAVQHNPASACNGLAVTVGVGTPPQAPTPTFEQFTPLGTFNTFTYLNNGSSLGVCAYAVKVPVGQDLQVQASVTPSAFSAAVSPVTPPTANNSNRPIQIIAGNCAHLPPAVPSPSVLGSKWWTCGDYAYNVNFVLQPSGSTHLMSAGGSQGLLLGQPAGQPGALDQGPLQRSMLASGNAVPAVQPQGSSAGTPDSSVKAQSAKPGQKALANADIVKGEKAPPGRSQSSSPATLKITNDHVMRMVKAGVPDSAIVSSIQSRRGEFDLSADGLLALHRAGVSQKILETMIASQSAQPSPAADTSASVTGDEGAAARSKAAAKELKPRTNLAAAKPGPQVKNQHAAQAHAAMISVLQKQRSTADAEAAQMRAAIPAQAQVGMLTGQPQPMSAVGAKQTSLPIVQSQAAAATPQTLVSLPQGATGGILRGGNAVASSAAGATLPQVGNSSPTSPLLSGGSVSSSPAQAGSDSRPLLPGTGISTPPTPPSSMTHATYVNSTVLVCTNNPQFRILTVSGSQSTVVFTPIDQYNLYTITGCSFGSPGSSNNIYLYGTGNLKMKFRIQFWSDNSIAVSLDPALGGLPDLNNLTLVVQRGDGQETEKGGFSFYAVRRTVQLSSIPQSWVTLFNGFGGFDTEYSSPPASALAGAHPNPTILPPGPSAGSMYVSRSMDGHKPSLPPGANDYYDFSGLAAGWTTDSFQLTSYDQHCPWTVTYRQNFGNWSANWDGNNIRVAPAFTVCSGFDPTSMEFGVPLRNYQNWDGSYYALKVWVTGPLGIDPITGQTTAW